MATTARLRAASSSFPSHSAKSTSTTQKIGRSGQNRSSQASAPRHPASSRCRLLPYHIRASSPSGTVAPLARRPPSSACHRLTALLHLRASALLCLHHPIPCHHTPIAGVIVHRRKIPVETRRVPGTRYLRGWGSYLPR
jgi:hypothetical protein